MVAASLHLYLQRIHRPCQLPTVTRLAANSTNSVKLSGRRVCYYCPLRPTNQFRKLAPHAASLAGESAPYPDDHGRDSVIPQKAVDLLAFTIPTLAIWLMSPILSLVDTAVVGTKSTLELAAMGPGTLLCDQSHYLFTFLATAACNKFAVGFLKHNQRAMNDLLSDAVVIGLLAGCAVGAVLFAIAPALLQWIAGSNSANIVAPAAAYVRIRCLGLPASFTTFMTHAFFLAARDPRTPLRAAVVAGLVNLVGDLALVNGAGMGLVGAAIATVAAQVLTALLCVRALHKPLEGHTAAPGWQMAVHWQLPAASSALQFFSTAAPIAAVLAAKVVTYGAISSVASGLNTLSCAAHHVVFSLLLFCSVFGDAVSQAAQTYLPPAIGTPGVAWQLARQLMTVGLYIGAFNCIAAGSVAVLFPHTFTRSPQVVALIARLVPVLCGALLTSTCSTATEGMLLAGQDWGFLVSSYLINMAVVLATLAMVRTSGVGLAGIWGCVVQFQVARLLVNAVRLHKHNSPLNQTVPLTAKALS